MNHLDELFAMLFGLIIQSPMNNRNDFMTQFIEVAASIDETIVPEGMKVALRYATGTR